MAAYPRDENPPPSALEVNRVQAFYHNEKAELENLISSHPFVETPTPEIDPVLEAELQAKLAFIEANPQRIDCAREIAEIYYTVGKLKNSLEWLLYAYNINEVPNNELGLLMAKIRKEIRQDKPKS